MNDKTLADRIVALGVAAKAPCEKEWWIYYIPEVVPGLTAENFVRDWRVAGALMEKCTDLHYDTMPGITTVIAWANNGNDSSEEIEVTESLPRAIIEACVEALETNDE